MVSGQSGQFVNVSTSVPTPLFSDLSKVLLLLSLCYITAHIKLLNEISSLRPSSTLPR